MYDNLTSDSKKLLHRRAMDCADIAENKGDSELRTLWVERAMVYWSPVYAFVQIISQAGGK